MQAPRRLQLRRGNTAAVSSYLGAVGELIVNTDTNALYVHNGITVGGISTVVDTSAITSNISSLQNDIATLTANAAVQAGLIANATGTYSNVNVKTYLTNFDGNLIPSANVTYNLGSSTNQWKDLFVSNNTIHIGGTPISIDNGTLLINNAPINSYNQSLNTTDEIEFAGIVSPYISFSGNVELTAGTDNITPTSWIFNSNGSLTFPDDTIQITAFTGLTGYATEGYVTTQINNLIGSAPGTLDTLGEIAASLANNTSLSTTLTNSIGAVDANIITANTAMKGYVDAQDTAISNSVTGANAAIVTVNTAMKGYADAITTAWTSNATTQLSQITGANAAIVTANTAMKGYVDSLTYSNYSNTNVSSYLSTASISTTGNIEAANFIGNISITGNVTGTSPNVTVVAGAYSSVFDNRGNLTVAGNLNVTGTASNRLVTKVAAYVNAGDFVVMDNIKATITSSAPRGLSLATVSGTFSFNIGGTFGGAAVGGGGSSAIGTLTTTPTSSIFGWGFSATGDIATFILTESTYVRCYRITIQIGSGFFSNMVSIERLI